MLGKTPKDEEFPESPRLRQLRWLVTALTVTLILGVITIVGLLVIRLSRITPPPPLPSVVDLPAGETATAMTQGSDWIAIVTTDKTGAQRIRVLDRATGAERGLTLIAPGH